MDAVKDEATDMVDNKASGKVNVNGAFVINSSASNALCGYPLVKVPVEKICSFAPILLRFDYFRQNIWRLFFAQFHF